MAPVYRFLADRIGQRLGRPVELVVGRSFDQFEAGQADLGVICGLPYVWLAVTDSGRGLDGEPLDGLFEPFARADQARVRDQDRFGLGLALVRAVVQAHDGQVRASRRPEGGSTFQIWLPLA